MAENFRKAERCPLCPNLDFNLLGNCQGVVYFDAEVPDRAFDLGMPEQQLDAGDSRATIDQCRVRRSARLLRTSSSVGMRPPRFRNLTKGITL